MFSPYYSFARRGGRDAEPEEHCAINVALYGPGGRWAMTERGAPALTRAPDRLRVGPSEMAWDGTSLTVRVDEICAPIPKRLRGTIRATPAALTGTDYAIDGVGRHLWRPIAPIGRVEVAFNAPELAWRGEAYFDGNAGVEPLERAFSSWTWGRARHGERARILYDVERLAGGPLSLALDIGPDGAAAPFEAPPTAALPKTLWRVPRATRCDAGFAPRVVATLEDAPFYNRSRIVTRLAGAEVAMMHESLSLERFRQPVVQAMLPFRMPRRR